MFGHNLRFLRKKHHLSQARLSKILGIARTTLGDYERGKTEPNFELLRKIARYFKLSLDELIMGKLEYQKTKIDDHSRLKILSIAVDAANDELIQLVASKARAGYIEGCQDPEYIADLPQIRLPMVPKGSYRAFEIEGDSMYPLIDGSVVLCSFVEHLSDIKDGRCYVVISAREGIVYKRLRNDPQHKRLILISDNDLYLPYAIEYTEVDELWEYQAHIAFDDQILGEDALHKKLDKIERRLSDIENRL